MTKKLLICLNVDSLLPEYYEQFEKAGDLDITFVRAKDVKPEDVKGKHIIVGNVPPAMLKQADSLELMQLNSAGFDNYLGFVPKNAHLCTSVGAFSPAVGEHMLAMTFSLIRHFHQYRDKQNNKDWSDLGKITSVEGSTIAVLGLGDIGRSYAKKVKALGAKTVIGVRRNANNKPEYIDEMYALTDLKKAIEKADIVCNVLPSSKETIGLFNENTFNMMKDGAYFINVGRGDAVNQDDLLKALRSGKLAGAASDVFVPEPLPKDSPLWDEPKLLITPHVAGWFFLKETLDRIIRISSSNVRAFLEGKDLVNDEEH